jgi:hypothetical protein
MKYIIAISILLTFISCRNFNSKKTTPENILRIEISGKVSSEVSDILERIEIIPLVTDSASILDPYATVRYCKENNLLLILDYKMVLSLFKGDGSFIANSRDLIGQGPEEYWRVSDALYNPFSQSVELLDPFGTIFRFDTELKYKEKISLSQKGNVYDFFLPFDTNKYFLSPTLFTEEDESFYFTDYNYGTLTDSVSFHENIVARPTMNMTSYMPFNGKYYFTPPAVDYYFYEINIPDRQLIPVVYLDFGEKEISKKKLDGMFGRFGRKNPNSQSENDLAIQVSDYLSKNSDYPLPIVKLMNEQYVYVHLSTNGKRSSFIYNLKTEESYMQPHDSSFKFFPSFHMEGNVLFALVNPFELERYIDKHYMTPEEIRILESIENEDNPILVKYYLK